MKIETDPVLRQQAINALRDEYQMTTQRPGVHQSDLSYCLSKAYWNRVDPMPPTEHEVLLFAIGFGMERVLLSREETPAEIVVDGISLSLDTIKLFGPVDLKTTRMSPTKDKGCVVCGQPRSGHPGQSQGHKYEPDRGDFNMPEGWKRQFMAYRYGLNMTAPPTNEPQPVDYSFGAIVIHLIQPEVTAWQLTFTHNELVENWNYLLERHSQLDRMLAAQDPMPYQWNEDYECNGCRFSLLCSLEASLKGTKTDAASR